MKKQTTISFIAMMFLMFSVNCFISSCSGENDEESNSREDKEYYNDNESPAVTGGVTDITPIGATITCKTNVAVSGSKIEMYVQFCDDKETLEKSADVYGEKGVYYHKANYQLVGTEYKVIIEDHLNHNTKYYYRACVRIDGSNSNTWFGKIREFKTKDLPAPTTGEVLSMQKKDIGNAYYPYEVYEVKISGRNNIDMNANYSKYIYNGIRVSSDKEFKNGTGCSLLDIDNSQGQDFIATYYVLPNTTYYYSTYLWWYDSYFLRLHGETKSFTTPQ